MTQQKRKSADKAGLRKTLVRGADGGLYLLTEEPFEISKLPQEKEKEVTKVLEKAQMNPVPLELPEHLVEEIQGIKTLGDQIAVSPETFVNDIPRNE